MENKQTQKAGDNSQQVQVVNPTIIMGIDEKRAREIFMEMSQTAIADNTVEANEVANQRINQFANQLLPRIQQIENDYRSFSEPAFQILLKKAQLTAACTEREDDYSILSELLVHRIKNKHDVKKKASISKAVEIIDHIDDDSLLAMTVFLTIENFIPVTGIIYDGLQVLDALYGKFDLDNLPTETLWMDNLSILGAINTVSFGSMKSYEEYCSEVLSGYICTGIKKGSDNHQKAIQFLAENILSESILTENELLPDYLRLQITNVGFIDQLSIANSIIYYEENPRFRIPLSDNQKKCLKDIWDMYDKDPQIVSQVRNKFTEKLNTFPNIVKTKTWWDSLKGSIHLTSVGKVIAHTNAKSIDNTLPDLD